MYILLFLFTGCPYRSLRTVEGIRTHHDFCLVSKLSTSTISWQPSILLNFSPCNCSPSTSIINIPFYLSNPPSPQLTYFRYEPYSFSLIYFMSHSFMYEYPLHLWTLPFSPSLTYLLFTYLHVPPFPPLHLWISLSPPMHPTFH